MGMFVSGRVAVTATGPVDEKDITSETDVIFIRPKMDYGTRQRVSGAASKVSQIKGNRKQRRAAKARGEEIAVQLDVGLYQVALLVENILAWQGPSFAGYACEAKNIERLDPQEPLVMQVIQEIADRNADPDDTDSDETEGDDPNVIEVKPIRSLTKS